MVFTANREQLRRGKSEQVSTLAEIVSDVVKYEKGKQADGGIGRKGNT